MAEKTDVIVVGAVVVGASTAFHLARLGAGRVTVIERRWVASGNTRKSGALVRMHYTDPHQARLALASLPYFQHWADLVGGDCGFRQTGYLMVVSPENAERLRQNVAMLQGVGVNTRLVSPGEIRELQPHASIEGIGLGAYEPESGFADGRKTAEAFMRRAVDLGVTLREGVAVTGIRVAGERVTGVETSAGPVDADAVVIVAGPWSVALLKGADVDLPITPRRAELAFVRRPASFGDEHMVFMDNAAGCYFRPHAGLLSAVGTGRRDYEVVADLDNYDERNAPGFIEESLARVARRLPEMREAAYETGHAGVYDMSPDGKAILDRAPGVGGLYIAAGFSGTGFKKSPAVGACMAELVTEGAARTCAIAPFCFGRFAEGQPLSGNDYLETSAPPART
ncbi:MAG TPA: FAD-dependent oxidoreductase [Dehalococcoidia bacterium]|nr:FAD-dependent oxidoreductase [Dehalococcoidia bacterium]